MFIPYLHLREELSTNMAMTTILANRRYVFIVKKLLLLRFIATNDNTGRN